MIHVYSVYFMPMQHNYIHVFCRFVSSKKVVFPIKYEYLNIKCFILFKTVDTCNLSLKKNLSSC